MARFLGGLNEKIAGFVEMFLYHTLQDLVDQAMHTERKIQQETRRKSYASHSITVSWRKKQSVTSFGGGRTQGTAASPSSSIAPLKMAISTASSPAKQQRPATNPEETKEIQQQVEELMRKGMWRKVFHLVQSLFF